MTFQRTLLLNFPLGQGHVPHSTTPFPQGKCNSGAYFLPYWSWMHGPLPAELKFRENTGFAISRLPSLCLEKRFCFGDIINPLLITKLALSIWMNVCLVHFYIWLHLIPEKCREKRTCLLFSPLACFMLSGDTYCSQVTFHFYCTR